MTEKRLRLLLVDDEGSLRLPLKQYLENNFGYQVNAVASGEEALELARQADGRYDVVLLDEVLMQDGEPSQGSLSGIETMQQLKTLYPDLEAIIFTGWGADAKQQALRAGAFRYLQKPIDYDELAMVIRTAAQQVRLREIGRVIFTERSLERVLERLLGAAASLTLADEAAIALRDLKTAKYQIYAQPRPKDQPWMQHFHNRHTSLEIVEEGRIISVPHTGQDRDVNRQVIDAGIASFLGLPIPGEGRNLGALYVYSHTPGRFEDWGSVSVLQTLAGQAGLALSNVRAFRQIRSHVGYMESLVQTARELTRATTQEEQLQLAWKFVREQLRVRTFFVALYDPATDVLSFPLLFDKGQELEQDAKVLGDDPEHWGVAGWTVKHGQELLWQAAAEREAANRDLEIKPTIVGEPCQSCFCLPLVAGDEVAGVVSIQSYDPYAFDEALLNTFRALGSQLVVALDNVKLLEAEARRRREAETLREAALALTETLELSEILERILCKLQEVVPYDSASVQLLQDRRLEIIDGRGFPNPREIVGYSFPVDGDNPNRLVVSSRQPLIVADAQMAYRGFREEPTVHAQVRGWLGVPMLVGDRLIGMITLDKHQPGFYTSEHASLAQTFAIQAAAAIENARLYEETQRWAANLDTLQELALTLNSSLALNETLEAACRAAVEFFAADHSGLVLFEEPGHRRGEVAAEYPDLGTRGTTVHVEGVPLEEMLVQEYQPLVLHDVAATAELGVVGDMLLGFDIQSILIVPVVNRGGELLGSLSLDAVGRKREFTADEVELCKVFAAHVAVAADNARLYLRLAEANEWRKTLVENAFDPVVAIDQRKKITVFNRRAEEMFGRTSDEMVGRTVTRLHCDKEVARQLFQAVSDAGSIRDWRADLLHRDGTQIPALISATVIHDSLGRPIGQAGFMRDLRRVRLLEARLRALIEVSKIITGSLHLDQVLNQVVDSALAAFPTAQHGSIHLHDEGTDRLCLRAFTGNYGQVAIEAACLDPGEGIAGWVYRQREPVVVDDAEQDARFKPIDHPDLPRVRSMVCAPLVAREGVIGTLSLDNLTATGAFDVDDLSLVVTFADQAAIAIENARLYDETRRRGELLEVLYEASNALVTSTDLDQVLQDIVERARKAAGARVVSMVLIDQAFQVRSLIVAGLEQQVDREEIVRPEGLSMTAMHSGERIVLEQIDREHHQVNPSPFWQQVAAAVCLPLILEGQPVGVVWFYYDQPRSFSESEVEAMQLYTNQAALAYDNARRIKELEHLRQAAEALAGAASLPEVLAQIVRSARAVLDADSAVIWSYDDVHHQFIIEETAFDGVAAAVLRRYRKQQPKKGGTTDTVMERGWLGVTDIQDPTCYDFAMGPSTRDLLESIGSRSFQGVALGIGDEKLGVLYVNYCQPRGFGPAERQTLETLASHASLALKSARLRAQRERARRAAQVIAEVTVQEDLEQTLQTIARHAYEVLDSYSVTIYSYDERQGRFDGWATHSDRGQSPGAARPPEQLLPSSVTERILELDSPPYHVMADRDASSHPLLGGYYTQVEQIRASLGIQLRVGERQVGVLFVNYRTPHRFTLDEMGMIHLFVDQAAVAIRNAQLYRQSRERANVLEALYRSGQAITGSLAEGDVLGHVVEQAWQLAEPSGEKQAQLSTLALRHGDFLDFVATWPPEHLKKLKAQAGQISLKPGGGQRIGVSGRAVLISGSQRVGDVTRDEDYIRYDPQTRSEMAVPLSAGDEVIGVINVEHPDVDAFDDEDQRALESLAAQAALAIQNARLYQAERQRAREFYGLYEISKTIRSLTHIDEVYYQINANMARLMGVEMCAVLLHDPEQEALVCQVPTFGVPDGISRRYRIPLAKGSPAVLWAEQEHLIVNDVDSYPLVAELQLQELVREAGLHHTLLVKLVAGDEEIGIIQVSNKLDGMPFREDDAHLLGIFSAQAAAVIANARLYERLRRAYDELRRAKGVIGARTALAWLGMASSTWRHTIDKHAITICDQAALLREDWPDVPSHPSRSTVTERIETIERLARQILEKPITPPLSGESGLEEVSLNALVDERTQQLWGNDPYKRVPLQLDLALVDGVTVCVSPEWLRRALDIVIENAVDAVQGRDVQEIVVGTRQVDGGAEIWVSDTGPGIPDEIVAKLGLELIERPEDAQGLGMGLLMAQTILQTFNGEIKVVQTGPEGTTMSLCLPLEN